MNPELSHEIRHLDNISLGRYKEKLMEAGMSDPYQLPRSLLCSPDALHPNDLPDFEWPDIYSYLIEYPSPYTKNQLRAFKSLDAYGYLKAGKVYDGAVWQHPQKDRFLLITKVKHGQKERDTPVRPWVILNKSGQVICCHCTCMAGLGETCSHVAASMFALWKLCELKKSETCTSLPCMWIRPSAAPVQYKEASDIDYTRPNKFRCQETPTKKKVATPDIPPPTKEQADDLYAKLASGPSNPAILSIVPTYAERFVPKSTKLPPPLTKLYDPNLPRKDVEDRCNQLYESLNITGEQIAAIMELTRSQAKSKVWFTHRAGRITASNFRAATHTNVDQPSSSLIKRICYPEMFKFSTAATRWGCKHEMEARSVYETIMQGKHQDFSVEDAGLMVSAERSYCGASADGLTSCTCCGKGCMEVKCPSCINVRQAVEESSKRTCLVKNSDGSVTLKRDHPYFYQVQAQIYCLDLLHCDFVVWQPQQIFIQRIIRDNNLLQLELPKVDLFFRKCILPELVGKVYTVAPPTDTDELPSNAVCYCKCPPSGHMLTCSAENCKIQFFHKACLGLKRAPKKWFCNECRRLVRSKET